MVMWESIALIKELVEGRSGKRYCDEKKSASALASVVLEVGWKW